MVTAFPARGQKAPAYWDDQLKAYIDEHDAAKADASALTSKANDSVVVKLSGNQSIDGVKTFIQPPVVPNDAFALTKITGLIDALADLDVTKAELSHTHTMSQISDASANGRSLVMAANYAAMRTLLGVESVPIRFSSTGAATIKATGTDRANAARTITLARMRVTGAPVGSNLVVQVQHATAAAPTTWTTVTTLTLAAGSTTEQVSGVLSQAQAAGDLVRLNITSVGSTTPADGVVVDVFLA